MFIRRELETQINNILYKHYLQHFADLKPHLPFKDVTDEKIDIVLDILKDSVLAPLLRDIKLPITAIDDMYTYESTEAKKVYAKYIVRQNRIQTLVHGVSGVTKEVIEILKSIDKDGCVVGGCVRDGILGFVPKDWDFVSGLDYDTLEKHFIDAGFEVKETGKEFLVLNVIKNSENFEIALFRKDGMYEDGRRPESVEVGTIFDDANRRDFTVNALYYNLSTDLLLDPTGQGIADIINDTLRFVGNPNERIKEDHLRMIRFYRFLDKGFTPDNKSLKAVRDNWNDLFALITPDRARTEIEKMVMKNV
jgi:hypothetical protein